MNYVGSVGTRFDTTHELIGQIGKREVVQVHKLVQELLQSNPKIDAKNVFLWGGSHGGFTVTHLTSQFPVKTKPKLPATSVSKTLTYYRDITRHV